MLASPFYAKVGARSARISDDHLAVAIDESDLRRSLRFLHRGPDLTMSRAWRLRLTQRLEVKTISIESSNSGEGAGKYFRMPFRLPFGAGRSFVGCAVIRFVTCPLAFRAELFCHPQIRTRPPRHTLF